MKKPEDIIGEKAKGVILLNRGGLDPFPYPERLGLARMLAGERLFRDAGMLLAPGKLEKTEGWYFWTLEGYEDGVMLCPADDPTNEELLEALERLFYTARALHLEASRQKTAWEIDEKMLDLAQKILLRAGVNLD